MTTTMLTENSKKIFYSLFLLPWFPFCKLKEWINLRKMSFFKSQFGIDYARFIYTKIRGKNDYKTLSKVWSAVSLSQVHQSFNEALLSPCIQSGNPLRTAR